MDNMDDIHRPSKLRSFLQEDILEGPPSCTKADFFVPRLRRCPFDLDTVDWGRAEMLGAGIDGVVWKVRFQGDEAYYALKVYWDNEPPPKSFYYYAAQRECQNNAVLQMITAAVEDANKKGERIFIERWPERSYHGAMTNLLRFSDEYREAKRHVLRHAEKLEKVQAEVQPQPRAGVTQSVTDAGTEAEIQQPIEDKGNDKATTDGPTSETEVPAQNAQFSDRSRIQIEVPPLVKCFGWLPFHGAQLLKLPPHKRPGPIFRQMKVHVISTEEEYTAIVYEYVRPGETTEQDVERAILFFYQTGFCISVYSHMRNWRQGKLLDISDIVFPRSTGWQRSAYRRRATQTILNNK